MFLRMFLTQVVDMKMSKINSKKNILKDFFRDNPNKVLCVHVINNSYDIPLKKNTIRTYLDILEDEGFIKQLSKGECAYSTYTHKMYQYNDKQTEVDMMNKIETSTEGVFKYLKRNIPLDTTFRTKNIKKKFKKPKDVSKVLHNLYKHYENVEKVDKSGKRNIYKFVDNSELKRKKKKGERGYISVKNGRDTKTARVIKEIAKHDSFCMHGLNIEDPSSAISKLKSDGYLEVIRKEKCSESDIKHSVYTKTKKFDKKLNNYLEEEDVKEQEKEKADKVKEINHEELRKEVSFNEPEEISDKPKIEIIDLHYDEKEDDYVEEVGDDRMTKKEEKMLDMMDRMLKVMEKMAE